MDLCVLLGSFTQGKFICIAQLRHKAYRCIQIIFKYIKNKNDLAEKWQKLHIMLLTFIQFNQLKSPLKE